MSNAAKYRKKAAEFEQLRQVDRAIASYIKAIEQSETEGEDVDVALFNKVGDLTLRQGRVADAVTYYERAVEHYATAGLFNNAIALCNKILRSAPGRANVYFSLGRICAKKGLRGDATRNFLEYAKRMQQDGRVDEGMRALAEIADLMPELEEVRRLVEEHAVRAGITLPQRRTPVASIPAQVAPAPGWASDRSSELVFLDVGESRHTGRPTPPMMARVRTPPTPVKGIIEYIVPPEEVMGDFEPVPDHVPDHLPTPTPTPKSESVVESVVHPIANPIVDLVVDPIETGDNSEMIEVSDMLDGLEVSPRAADFDIGPLVGFTSDEPDTAADEARDDAHDLASDHARRHADDESPDTHVAELTWLVPESDLADVSETAGLMPTDEGADTIDAGLDAGLDAVSGLQLEETEQILDTTEVLAVVGGQAGQPPVGAHEARGLTPLGTSPIPELETAIEAGARAAALADADETVVLRRPPFRLDPHDFILPGELPPMVVDDALLEYGLEEALHGNTPTSVETPGAATDHGGVTNTPAVAVRRVDAIGISDADDGGQTRNAPEDASADNRLDEGLAEDAGIRTATADAAVTRESGSAAAGSLATDDLVDDVVDEATEGNADSLADDVTDIDDDDDAGFAQAAYSAHAVHSTPSLPIAAVAVEANAVAASRRDELRAAVARAPHDWVRRRRLAEALFEAGEREAGLSELQAALTGFAQSGALDVAADIADELVGISPERIPYHQKRVELAVRLNDQVRLRLAYLDLADSLVTDGDEVRAHAVFARVLELDPWDERARLALGAAAPPPPVRQQDSDYVDLATWLRDDAPISTRMRMQEPKVTGDEQADFDALLRHFKEGVARSVGEEDFESRYDLGVAYKEMGLLDDAIGEFQKALRSGRHRLPAYEALGQCFVEQTRYSVAATVLTRALHEPGLTDEKLIGVLYLLAYSCEALQRWEEARGYYSRVYATDINFRDAAARLAALDQITR